MNKGSIDKFLAEVVRKEKNALDIITLYNELYLTKEDKITIEYLQENGNVETFEIPSIAYMNSTIKRLEKNITEFSSIGITQANMILPDGSKRVVLTKDIQFEPPVINISSNNVKKFGYKNYDIISNMISPKIFIPLTLQKNNLQDTNSRVLYNKVSISLNTQEEIDFYNQQLKNRSSIDYDTLLQTLQANYIEYKEYNEILDCEPKLNAISGFFGIVSYEKRNLVSNGMSKSKIFYKLDKTIYKNNVNGSDVNLKIGDELVLNTKNNKNSVFKVDSVDQSNNEITVIQIEGFGAPFIGKDVFVISPKYSNDVLVNVPIVANEIFCLFAKSINSVVNSINSYWGSGSFVETNELKHESDENVNFANYFNDNVKSIKGGLELLSESGQIPITDLLEPNSPIINQTDFNVEIINAHKISENERLLAGKISEKEVVRSNISVIDETINNLKAKLSETTVQKDRNNITKEIENQYNKRKIEVTSFSSIMDEITSTVKNTTTFKPKYRVRGFFDIPQGRYSNEKNKKGYQEIIGFECEYRYLRKDEKEDGVKTVEYKSINGEKIKATYSNWNELTLKKREKFYSLDSKAVEFVQEDPLNPEFVNINQIEIPISNDEAVEIRIKSISEVGYPTVTNKSQWSNSVIIPFPEEFANSSESIYTKLINDKSLTIFENELTKMGVYSHLSDSISSGEKVYKHNLENIATNYYTPENKQLSASQVVDELKQKIEKYESILTGQFSDPDVEIQDENGNPLSTVLNNDTVSLFAGNYKKIVDGKGGSKGEILTFLYYISIKNLKSSDVELISYVPGLYENKLPKEEYTDYVYNKYEYDGYRKFYNVPVSYRGTVENDELIAGKSTTSPFIELPGYHSSQVKGQILYSRNTDVSLSNELYVDVEEDNGMNIVKLDGGTSKEKFIFKEFNGGEIVGDGNYTDFCIHVDHPSLKIPELQNSSLYDQKTFVPKSSISNKKVYYPMFWNSKLSPIESSQKDYFKQLSYKRYTSVDDGSAKIKNFPRKISFQENDKYLIGKETCGAYLFLGPQSQRSMFTESNIYNNGIIINNGKEIKIPVIFQARLSDYFGSGDAGAGRIGGDENKQSIFYSKKIGIDFVIKNKSIFSFDIKVDVQY